MPDLQTESGHEPLPPATPWALHDLPAFPLVATRLMATFTKQDVDIREVGELIAAEPVFAARVLQLANSPLFALQRQVKTISYAVVLLGLERVKAITFTSAMEDFVTPVLGIAPLRLCWQNSLAVALIAEKLGRAARMQTDLAYVAGLLRDVGRLALLVKHPKAYVELLAAAGQGPHDLLAMEHELFDVDHCEAGAWLLRRLAFPPDLAEVITDHHRALDSRTFRMVHLVQCADRLADAFGFGVVAGAPGPVVEHVLEQLPVWARGRLGDGFELQWTTEIATRLQAWR